jgi:multicomponent Na+:H+ antiporter subunit A
LLTGTGGLALLAGMILLGNVAGSFELSVILTMGDEIRADPLYIPILILFLAGAFTKSAQFPFHFWLPNAMAAPTPVSAYLHSATMVKAGVYLMARMNPALGGTEPWFWALVIAGGFTDRLRELAGRAPDRHQAGAGLHDAHGAGALTLFIGAGSSDAIKAAMMFLVVHSLYKAALFLMIGLVDHETGTREVDKLRGLRAPCRSPSSPVRWPRSPWPASRPSSASSARSFSTRRGWAMTRRRSGSPDRSSPRRS